MLKTLTVGCPEHPSVVVRWGLADSLLRLRVGESRSGARDNIVFRSLLLHPTREERGCVRLLSGEMQPRWEVHAHTHHVFRYGEFRCSARRQSPSDRFWTTRSRLSFTRCEACNSDCITSTSSVSTATTSFRFAYCEGVSCAGDFSQHVGIHGVLVITICATVPFPLFAPILYDFDCLDAAQVENWHNKFVLSLTIDVLFLCESSQSRRRSVHQCAPCHPCLVLPPCPGPCPTSVRASPNTFAKIQIRSPISSFPPFPHSLIISNGQS